VSSFECSRVVRTLRVGDDGSDIARVLRCP